MIGSVLLYKQIRNRKIVNVYRTSAREPVIRDYFAELKTIMEKYKFHYGWFSLFLFLFGVVLVFIFSAADIVSSSKNEDDKMYQMNEKLFISAKNRARPVNNKMFISMAETWASVAGYNKVKCIWHIDTSIVDVYPQLPDTRPPITVDCSSGYCRLAK